MGSLLIEMRVPGGAWRKVAELAPGMREGSMSSNLPGGGRGVILFRCEGPWSVIEWCAGSGDYETDGGTVRVMNADAHQDLLAQLRDGESYELALTTDRGVAGAVRWTHVAG